MFLVVSATSSVLSVFFSSFFIFQPNYGKGAVCNADTPALLVTRGFVDDRGIFTFTAFFFPFLGVDTAGGGSMHVESAKTGESAARSGMSGYASSPRVGRRDTTGDSPFSCRFTGG